MPEISMITVMEFNIQYVYDKSDHCFPGQNGIWVKYWHFWPKNDGEKWSRKNTFEIPTCAHHAIFINELVLLIKTPLFYEVN